MTFSIPPARPPIKIQSLANIQTKPMIQTPIIMGSIFQPIYATVPCSSCGK